MRREHHLDPLTRYCDGCGKSARDIGEEAVGRRKGEEAPSPECPAFYRQIEGALVIITTKEQLIVRFSGGGGIQCGQHAMFEIRDAIDEGVGELRDGGRSEVMPT